RRDDIGRGSSTRFPAARLSRRLPACTGEHTGSPLLTVTVYISTRFFILLHLLCGDVAKTFSDVAKTFGDVAKTLGDVAKTFSDVAKTFSDVAKTFGDVAKTFGDVAKTFGDVAKTLGDVAKTFSDTAEMSGYTVKTSFDATITEAENLLPAFTAMSKNAATFPAGRAV
ncbi:MAG: hypothetical protein LBL42_06855, partial [Tannerella sp.]|nr:hypothetical protein [Tannerella sp.]